MVGWLERKRIRPVKISTGDPHKVLLWKTVEELGLTWSDLWKNYPVKQQQRVV